MIDATRFRELVELWERASLNRPAFDADGDKYAEARYQVAEMRLLHFVTSHAAELLALVEASRWRTMESAPKNGTPFLGFIDRKGEDFNEIIVVYCKHAHDDEPFWTTYEDDHIGWQPTHWQPLPPAPTHRA